MGTELSVGEYAATTLSGANWKERYRQVRAASEAISAPLAIEDYVIQSMPDVSPTKWHLAHTSWFFETFVLERMRPHYRPFHPQYKVLFNSYYNQVGQQHARPERGLLSRPTVDELFQYRAYIDEQMAQLLDQDLAPELLNIIETGLHHEQQHQELMLMDLKHVFSCNPLRPAYRELPQAPRIAVPPVYWHEFPGGLDSIGHAGPGFAYDNEGPRHTQYVYPFRLADRLVTCGEYLEFMADGGYRRPELWLSDGWKTVQERRWRAPLYWEEHPDGWRVMTLSGLRELNPSEPVCHVSYYEADAYARWCDALLPSEAAWEIAAHTASHDGNFLETDQLHPYPATAGAKTLQQMLGDLWEWTRSPYVPYPGYHPPTGPLGEYNGKFMCNQLVLRGGACVTPRSHIRTTYRNFFPPDARWAFSGIRLAEDEA